MPSSAQSSLRSSLRRASEMQSLGLEDELSFGSDEDLMETIGEIDVPTSEVDLDTSSSSSSRHDSKSSHHKLRGSSKSTSSLKASLKSKRKDNSLASTTHLLPPLPPVPSGSTLDLPAEMFGERERPKRGSLMGAIKKKGLRRWRDDGSSYSFVTESSQASTMSLHKVASNTSSRPSFTSSLANTPSTHASSAAPHITPMSLLTLDSVDRLSLGRESSESKVSPKKIESIAPSFAPAQLSLSRKTGATWMPSEISHAILPAFPATLAGLEPITVFTAQAAKRPPASILSSSADRGPNGFRQPPSSSHWTPCTLVFTRFKVALSGDDATVASSNGADEERTVAHVHVFSSQRLAPTSPGALRRSKSGAGFQYDPSAPRVEVERRTLSRDSTASVCESYTDHDGRRLVLSVYFGNEDRTKAGNEWILEMKDNAQLYEWIRQIKKTAIMINAEELGYGKAIRPVYEDTTTSADELAHKLSVHARAIAAQKDNMSRQRSTETVKSTSPPPSSSSLEDQHRTSLEALQGVAMSRSASADAVDGRTGSLGRSHRKSITGIANPIISTAEILAECKSKIDANGYDDDDDDEEALNSCLGGLSLNGISTTLSFGSSLSFPAPPSALPPPRRPPPVDYHVPLAPQTPDGSPVLASSASCPNVAGNAPANPSPRATKSSVLFGDDHGSSNGTGKSSVPASMLSTPTFGTASLPGDDEPGSSSPMSPPRTEAALRPAARSPLVTALQLQSLKSEGDAPSISSNTSGTSGGTSRLRRLRNKPQAIDIMAEFSSVEAENMPPPTPPPNETELVREERERRIRFA